MTETPPSPKTQSTPSSEPPGITEQWRRWYHAYRAWFADQPARELAITMSLGVLLAGLLLLVLRVVSWLVTGLNDWLFSSEKTASASAPPPQADGPPSPVGLATNDTIAYLAERIQDYSTAHAFGPDPTVVPLLWLLIGAVLVLFTRTLPGAVLFTGWSAATVWAVYTAIPGGNPVPAALLAGLIALAWCAWLLLSGLVKGLLNAVP